MEKIQNHSRYTSMFTPPLWWWNEHESCFPAHWFSTRTGEVESGLPWVGWPRKSCTRTGDHIPSVIPLVFQNIIYSSCYPTGLQHECMRLSLGQPGWAGPENHTLGLGTASVLLSPLDVQTTGIPPSIPLVFGANVLI